jgi:formamidopyrimidine-DNA glycosylase
MVEGHSVHRVAAMHRKRLVGKKFTAWSPNGRFKEGADLINNKMFFRVEAVGKNLFAFFGNANDEANAVVVHVHFGMAGNWAVYEDPTSAPEPSNTNRLRLEHAELVADLSAMTVQHGGMNLYTAKRAKLGEDPLREDADEKRLWSRVQVSKKSIGALIMDQSYFTGPGNIYRCEILFKAGVNPEKKGKDLEEDEFKRIWYHTVALLQRGYETGSILTVDPEEAKALGKPKMRRYIYNTSICPRCGSSIKSWSINNRTCYACFRCQPMNGSKAENVVTPLKDCIPFNSHCARELAETRLQETGPERLTVKEIKAELVKLDMKWPSNAKKANLVELLRDAGNKKPAFVSPEAAAAEKAAAGESLAVEHIAELAPGQARRARSRVLEFLTDESTAEKVPDEAISSTGFMSKRSRSVQVDNSKPRKSRR